MRGRVGFSVHPEPWDALANPLRQRAGMKRVVKIRVSRVYWKLVKRSGYGKFSVAVGRWGNCARECEQLVHEKRERMLGKNKRVAGRRPRLEDV